MDDTTRRLLAGVAAGFAANGPMTAFMVAARALLPADRDDPPPPRQITENLAETAGVGMTEHQTQAATMANHYAYGVGAGAVYGLVAPHMPLPPAARGVAFGLGLWAFGYLGWLPLTGLYRPPTREPAGRNLMIVGGHIVWGAVAGVVHDDLSRGHHRERAAPHQPSRISSAAASAR